MECKNTLFFYMKCKVLLFLFKYINYQYFVSFLSRNTVMNGGFGMLSAYLKGGMTWS